MREKKGGKCAREFYRTLVKSPERGEIKK